MLLIHCAFPLGAWRYRYVDNRATAHLAPRDIFATEFDRQFYRVTLMGDVPTGVDGQASGPSTATQSRHYRW